MRTVGGGEALDLATVEIDNVASAVEEFWISYYHI
tara:strand:+ start:385 stop:489 length:105 start_codon:yes stop_codon:yes gene_type:complete